MRRCVVRTPQHHEILRQIGAENVIAQLFYIRLGNGVHEKIQHHFVIKGMTVVVKSFTR